MLQDLRYALRVLLKSPSFAAAAIVSLALGIGANSAIFSVVNAVLIQPLSYQSPDELVVVHDHPRADARAIERVAPATFIDIKRRAQSFAEVHAFIDTYASAYNVTGVKESERLRAIHVTSGFFSMLGVAPVVGRELRDGEVFDDRALLISHRFWMRQLNGDAGVIGRRIALSERPHVIIGVLPAGFQFRRDVDLWRQSSAEHDPANIADRGRRWWSVVARLRPDVSLAQAQADLDAVSMRLAQEYPRENGDRGLRVVALHDDVTGASQPPLTILYAAVCLVLLIACGNVAGLLLARLSAREREIGVRVALGASRAKLARQLLAESMLLALPAAAAGLLLATWLVDGIVALAPADLPRLADVRVDTEVVLFTIVLSIGCAVLFGLAPLAQAGRVSPAQSLRSGRAATPSGQGVRAALIVAEMSLAMVLLVAAGLLLRSYDRLNAVESGFSTAGVAIMDVAPQSQYFMDDYRRVVAFHDASLAAVSAMPAVRSAAVTSLVPFGEGRFEDRIAAADTPTAELRAEYRFVSAGYFDTLRVPILSGREFSPADRADTQGVAILAASTASRLFGRTDPIGKVVILRGKTPRVVVGIVPDLRLVGLTMAPPLQVYAPFPQARDVFWTGLTFLIRTDGDPLTVAADARQRLLQADSSLPPFNVRTLDSLKLQLLAPTRMYSTLLGVFATLALSLACVGLYGLIAYFVTTRLREFGIRLALGARTGDIGRLVLGEAGRFVVIALLIGIAGALGAGRALRALLFEVTPTDWPSLIAAAVLLSSVAFTASYVPARRAMRLDPVSSLRAE